MNFSFQLDRGGFCCCIPLLFIGFLFFVAIKKRYGLPNQPNSHNNSYGSTGYIYGSSNDSDNSSYWGSSSSSDSNWSSDSYSGDSGGSWSSDSSSSSSDSSSGDSSGSW
ncbi:hypothetical protein [Herpetosiphon sp. NSE202]|uniref:hypothetical protein n=1 Tax=Herpetosiphon sp. NSE202 TaxID=3351349 RepID=UPI0036319EBD